MIPRSDSVRLAAALVEQICAVEGFDLDGPTIDSAIQVQVARAAAEMGVTDRTAAGCVPQTCERPPSASSTVGGHGT